MMHLVAELDSKAGDCQVGFSFEGREKEREREGDREPVRGSLCTEFHLNCCVLQSACDPQSCRKEESAPSRREAGKKGRGVQCVNKMIHIYLSLPLSKQETMSLLSFPFGFNM